MYQMFSLHDLFTILSYQINDRIPSNMTKSQQFTISIFLIKIIKSGKIYIKNTSMLK